FEPAQLVKLRVLNWGRNLLSLCWRRLSFRDAFAPAGSRGGGGAPGLVRMVRCTARCLLWSSETKRYKKTHKRRGAEHPQPTESKTFQSPSDNFDTEIRADKADAPST